VPYSPRLETGVMLICPRSELASHPRARAAGYAVTGVLFASSLTLGMLVATCAGTLAQTAGPQPKEAWVKSVSQHLLRYKRHPDNGKGCHSRSGNVMVHFAIDRQGRVLETHVMKSSGIKDLDRAALDIVEKASPLPAPPDQVAAERMEFDLPVAYRRVCPEPSLFKWW